MDVFRDEVRDASVHSDGGVEGGDVTAGGLGLGERGVRIGLVEENLALEVRRLDKVSVYEGEGPDAGAGQQAGGSRSCGSYANDGGVGGGDFLLAFDADAGEKHLAGVAFGVGKQRRHQHKV